MSYTSMPSTTATLFPKMRTETKSVDKTTETSGRDFDPNIPQAQIGIPVPAIIGRKRVPDANTIWTGNMQPIIEKTTTSSTVKEHEIGDLLAGQDSTINETTTIVETTAVVGYTFDILMGVCLGPGVVLKAIYVDNTRVWQGTLGPSRQSVTLGESATFLNKATIIFSGGAFNQAPEPNIDVVDFPGYVGIATVFMQNVRADLPMGNLSFEVTRIPNPLSLSDAINKAGDDVNIISALIEVITNPWGYGGLDISNIDTSTFTTMATTLIDEGNVVSMKIGSEVAVSSVIKSLQSQGSFVIFEEPKIRKITGRIINYDSFNYVTSKKFNTRNVAELRNYAKGGWQDAIEQAKGSYTERDNDYNEASVFLQNTANISNSGRGKRTGSIYYPYVPNRSLAQNLLYKDMRLLAAPIYRYSLQTNREGASCRPGDPILVSWPDFSLLNARMTVEKVRKHPTNLNNVTIDVTQRSFPYTSAIFGEGGNSFDPGFDLDPKTPVAATFITAPYFLARLRHALSAQQVTPLIYPMVLPTPDNDYQFSFSAYMSNVPDTTTDVSIVSTGLYPTYCELVGSINQYDDFADGIISSITVDTVVNPINLRDVGSAGVKAGKLLLFINNEIMSFESCVDNEDGTWTLSNVHRALLDTTFGTHADNSKIYIVSNNTNYIGSGFSYPLGFTPNWIITANSIMKDGLKSDGLNVSGWSPSYIRTLCPPRPHNTKVNSTARSSTPVSITEGASCTVTWTRRSRISLNVASMLDAGEVQENPTQLHRIFLVDSAAVAHDVGTQATASTHTFTVPDVANGLGYIYVRTEITLGGVTYNSQAQDRIPVNVT